MSSSSVTETERFLPHRLFEFSDAIFLHTNAAGMLIGQHILWQKSRLQSIRLPYQAPVGISPVLQLHSVRTL